MAQAGSPPSPCSVVFSSVFSWGGWAGTSRRCLSCHQLPLKSSANSVPKPTLAHTSHPRIQEEPQQWVQTSQKSRLVPAPQCSSLGTFSSCPQDPHGRLSAQHTLPCPCHMLLVVSYTPRAQCLQEQPPQEALLICPTQTWAHYSKTGPVSFTMLLPAGFCGELGPSGLRVPAGEKTTFPPRGFEAPAPITYTY